MADAAVDAAVHARPSVPVLHIHLLGDFRLISGETPVTSVDLPRLQSLLAYLALHHTAPQPRSHLAYLMWPDSTDEQALTNLRNAIHRLRHVLPGAGAFLHVTRQGLQWQSERSDVSWTLDVQEFERALARADAAERSRDLHAALQALTQAGEVYRGDLLPSCYDEWVIPERDCLRQAFLQALDRLIGLFEGEREYTVAIGVAQRLLRLDPLHEATYRHLMRLYAASGDRASALRTYHTCTTVLERELGAEPARATREAYERLLQKEEPEESRVALPAVASLWRSELLASVVYAFQWTALWPLLGSALELNHISEAMSHARALLAPSQQCLPDAIATLLAAAIEAWNSEQSDSARAHLQQAAALAREKGYL